MRSVVNWSIHFFESLLLQRIEIELVFSLLRPRSASPELLLFRIMIFMGVQCRKELGSIPIAPMWISLFLGNGNNERYRRRCVCVMDKERSVNSSKRRRYLHEKEGFDRKVS